MTIKRVHSDQIADNVGTTQKTVTRMLDDLEKQGLIQLKKNEIVVLPQFERAFD